MGDEQEYLTKAEAATRGDISEATIQRDRRAGRLPHHIYRSDGTLLIPVADLVAAGRLAPDGAPRAAATPGAPLGAPTSGGAEIDGLRLELAVLSARAAQLADEVTWLRALVAAGAR